MVLTLPLSFLEDLIHFDISLKRTKTALHIYSAITPYSHPVIDKPKPDYYKEKQRLNKLILKGRYIPNNESIFGSFD